MLAIVYWNGQIPRRERNAINLALLVGMLIGQITFGALGDRYGRRGMYGIVLIIIMGATVGLALSSKGAEDSVNILPWLIVWKLLMGFGMGGDIPLSAAITAESVLSCLDTSDSFLMVSNITSDSLFLLADSLPVGTEPKCLQLSSL
jgi:MFS family permease